VPVLTRLGLQYIDCLRFKEELGNALGVAHLELTLRLLKAVNKQSYSEIDLRMTMVDIPLLPI